LLISCLFRGKILYALSIVLMISSSCVISSLYSAHAQIDNNLKKYIDPGKKFMFLYPNNWFVRGTHDNVTGTTEVKLSDPNTLYSPNDPLFDSKTGKSVVPVRALKNFENEISDDFVFFNTIFYDILRVRYEWE